MTDLISRADALKVCQKIADYNIPQFCIGANTCRDAIAALPAAQVGVKPLEWHPEHGCTGRGLGLEYHMCETTLGLFAMYHPFHSKQDLPKAQMQAAAQADYETRIRAALIGCEA